MITDSQIEEWIREIEARPESAALILRAIAARLAELDKWNEELLADNIALRSGSRVEEYEGRIAALEYQLELLKRHAGGEAESTAPSSKTAAEKAAGCLLLFNAGGQVLRLPLPSRLNAALELARFTAAPDPRLAPGLVAAGESDELLFVFDSGRAVTLRAGEIETASLPLDWERARRLLPRPGEELAAVLPITALALADNCVQVSRRACAKLMPVQSFQSLVARGAVGAGIKRRPDKTAFLALCKRDDAFVIATREGALTTLPVSRLPYSVDEVLQLSASDHVVAAFPVSAGSEMLFVTNNAKAIRRDTSWLEPAGSFKSRGQALFSAARRESGVRLVGAAPVRAGDTCAALRSDGSLWAYPAGVLLDSGALDLDPVNSEILAFTVHAGRS